MMDEYRPGVGIVLLDKRGMIFSGMRIDTPGAWQMPQGGIDDGESPEEAAMRELSEEVGTNKVKIIAQSADWYYYDVPRDLADKLWGGRWRGQKQKWFLAELLGTDSDINVHTINPEFREWRWSRVDELIADIVAFKRPLYVAILQEFAPLISSKF